MSVRDMLLALCTVVIWGVNFIVTKVVLHDMPPLLVGAVRFILVAFPAIFLLPRPKVSLHGIVLYGLTTCFAQFAFLFCALSLGMPAGIASVILQSQVFFSILLGTLLLGEKIKLTHLLGMLCAIVGMIFLIYIPKNNNHNLIPLTGSILTLAAGLSWACGNMVNRSMIKNTGKNSMLSLVSWSALVPILPFLLCSWLFEGTHVMAHSLTQLDGMTFLALLYIAYCSTHVGYGIWSMLLSRYETWRVTPFALLVPVVGLSGGVLFLGESLSLLQFYGLLLIMLGVVINLSGSLSFIFRFHNRFR